MIVSVSAGMDKSSTPTVNQLLLEALDQRWKNYRAELKRCRAEFSNEAVHDLRSAARRMLALSQLGISVAPRPRLERLNRAFKDQLEEFNHLRDTPLVLGLRDFARKNGLKRAFLALSGGVDSS